MQSITALVTQRDPSMLFCHVVCNLLGTTDLLFFVSLSPYKFPSFPYWICEHFTFLESLEQQSPLFLSVVFHHWSGFHSASTHLTCNFLFGHLLILTNTWAFLELPHLKNLRISFSFWPQCPILPVTPFT